MTRLFFGLGEHRQPGGWHEERQSSSELIMLPNHHAWQLGKFGKSRKWQVA